VILVKFIWVESRIVQNRWKNCHQSRRLNFLGQIVRTFIREFAWLSYCTIYKTKVPNIDNRFWYIQYMSQLTCHVLWCSCGITWRDTTPDAMWLYDMTWCHGRGTGPKPGRDVMTLLLTRLSHHTVPRNFRGEGATAIVTCTVGLCRGMNCNITFLHEISGEKICLWKHINTFPAHFSLNLGLWH